MDSFVVVPGGFNPEEHHFFEYNPELRYFDCVDALCRRVGEGLASTVMWAIYFTEDPDSAFFNLDKQEARHHIGTTIFGDVNFDWDQYQDVINCYPDISMSKDKRRFKKISEQFDNLLDLIEFTTDIKEKVTIFSKLKVIYEGLSSVEEKYKKERDAKRAAVGEEQPGLYG